MIFDSEKKFEDAVVEELSKNGWDEQIIEYPTEDFLIDNWANILFEMQFIILIISNNRNRSTINEFI